MQFYCAKTTISAGLTMFYCGIMCLNIPYCISIHKYLRQNNSKHTNKIRSLLLDDNKRIDWNIISQCNVCSSNYTMVLIYHYLSFIQYTFRHDSNPLQWKSIEFDKQSLAEPHEDQIIFLNDYLQYMDCNICT